MDFMIYKTFKYRPFLMDACSLPIPYEYSKYLFYSSFLIGAASFVSLYYQDTLTFIFMFVMFISSIHFWRKPDYGLARDLDMFLCKIMSVYFFGVTVYFYGEYYQAVYIINMINILFLYMGELIFYAYKNKKWIIFHMSMHFYFAFFVPFVLYIL
jgi:hypothetical protein